VLAHGSWPGQFCFAISALMTRLEGLSAPSARVTLSLQGTRRLKDKPGVTTCEIADGAIAPKPPAACLPL